MIKPPDISDIIRKKINRRKNIHIGVFANNQLRKNVHNQIAAALMIDNALVHTTDKKEYSYFNCDNRIIEHPSRLQWKDFMFLLSQMDINLYNTYTESWGQVVVESLALSVPCITNNSSGVLSFHKELKEKLVVVQHDNPSAISKKIIQALSEKDQIMLLSESYIKQLTEISQERLYNFLN